MTSPYCLKAAHTLSNLEFDEIYAIMQEAFPKEERRNYANQKKLLENRNYCFLIRKDEGKITAFFAFWKFQTFWFGEHFAVDPSVRGKGLGGIMLDMLTQKSSVPFIIEVEPPENEITRRRIAFYQRHGFFLNNQFHYLLPPQQEGLPAVPLIIMSHNKILTQQEFELIKEEVYLTVYNVK